MATQNLIDKYRNASNEKKIDLILKNFKDYPRLMEGIGESIYALIFVESQQKRHSNSNQELGINVRGSGTSDPTAQEAINMTMIRKALRNGEFDDLRACDVSEEYIEDVKMLHSMREDYEQIQRLIQVMAKSGKPLLEDILIEHKDYKTIAINLHIAYETVRSRYQKAKDEIKRMAAYYFYRKYSMKEANDDQ